MIIVIHDANVLIDLHSAKLLDMFFQLDFESHTTDLVVAEIEQPLAPFIKSKRLRVKNWDAEELGQLALSRLAQPKQISIQDCSVLILTQRLGGILLTGDGNLRHCGAQAGLEVRGTLWVFDQLVESTRLSKRDAARLLEKLISEGRRLPAGACNERLQTWRGQKEAGT